MRTRARLALLTALAGGLPLALPAGAAAPDVPSYGCVHLTDQVGDVSDPDLDVVGLTLKTTPTALRAYLRVNALKESPRSAEAHRFAVSFTYRAARFTMAASESVHGVDGVRDLAPVDGRKTQLSVNDTLFKDVRSDLTATFDLRNSLVVFDLPVASITEYGGPGFGSGPGAVLTDLAATSATDLQATTYGADTTVRRGTVGPSYAVGDNSCFGPPSATLTLLSGLQSQYGDLAQVTARLTDASGRPLGGRTVAVSLAGSSTSATTSSDGVLRASLSPGVVAGSYPLALSWKGDSSAGGTAVTRAFSVVPESTRLTLTSTSRRSDRYVVAALKDDDGTPLSGATVTVTADGSSRSLLTSAKGVVELHDLSPNLEVRVAFDGVSGKWFATSATTRTTGGGKSGDDD